MNFFSRHKNKITIFVSLVIFISILAASVVYYYFSQISPNGEVLEDYYISFTYPQELGVTENEQGLVVAQNNQEILTINKFILTESSLMEFVDSRASDNELVYIDKRAGFSIRENGLTKQYFPASGDVFLEVIYSIETQEASLAEEIISSIRFRPGSVN